jgi:hypothetical protein
MTYADMSGSGRLAEAGGSAKPGTRVSHRRRGGSNLERIEMRLLVALTYPLFLAVAIASRLGLRRPSFNSVVSTRSKSVFAEARETAEATIPSAFLG